ncbi:hypothetical protein A6U86_32250 [Rhizobium sp. AC27/96]|nr:hypothetical protein A6U86_32250 [Rhizobium sp. AC27/96]
MGLGRLARCELPSRVFSSDTSLTLQFMFLKPSFMLSGCFLGRKPRVAERVVDAVAEFISGFLLEEAKYRKEEAIQPTIILLDVESFTFPGKLIPNHVESYQRFCNLNRRPGAAFGSLKRQGLAESPFPIIFVVHGIIEYAGRHMAPVWQFQALFVEFIVPLSSSSKSPPQFKCLVMPMGWMQCLYHFGYIGD